ncbi:MAG: helix-turn-helix domain-containing protein, partial [Olsenella sp.]|nr:helix-turn-helix domain-containing protein [Olsenella sp.]
MGKKGRFKHFDASQRRRLEAGLNAGDSLSEIARRLGVATSTVSREVKRNRRCDGPSRKASRDKNDCAFLKTKTCKHRNLCDIKGCGRLCRVCPRPCERYCPDYVPRI